MRPLVSICLPVYNGVGLVHRAVESAVRQDYEPLEIVVVDDHSSDGTATLVQARYGDRVNIVVNTTRLGLAANHDAAVMHARGDFVKFLHQDDSMEDTCVTDMVTALTAYPSAGLAFCRRHIELGENTPEDREWASKFGEVHRHFARLAQTNRGPELFADWLTRGFPENWIGEPVAVMVRRSALQRVGLFNRHTLQGMDIDLWMRILAQYDAVFLDRKLVTYRHWTKSSTARTVARHKDWLDKLWMLEGLTSYPELVTRYPRLTDLRRFHRRVFSRTIARDVLNFDRKHRPIGDPLSYVAYRARQLLPSRRRVTPFSNLPPSNVQDR
jgi:glycosyltransferase involved in cell wall biosynthesis